MTEEHKRKIAESNRGKSPSEETRKKISNTLKGGNSTSFRKGHRHSKETKQKLSKLQRGRRLTDEQKKNRKKWKHKEETKKKMSELHKGEKSYLWKGGITPLNHSIRHLFENRLWIKYCMERDNYQCQKCKVVGGDLEVHHKKPIRDIIKENNIHSVEDARKCLELWDLNNGTTLCSNCHASLDKYRSKTKRRIN